MSLADCLAEQLTDLRREHEHSMDRFVRTLRE
jgi:hypothetical protein